VKRFRLFMIIGVALPIVIIFVLHRFTEPIYVAAFLGAWPVSAVAFYDHFVNVSAVKFDKQRVWKDSLQMINRGGVTWNFLRLPVENSGFAPAKNCTAELEVTKRPGQASQNCPAPSAEPKALTWVSPKLEDKHTIPSRRGTAALAIVIDDTSVPSTARSWHAVNDWGPLTLWAGTTEVFAMPPATRTQDAFCQGDYEIKVTVFPENGSPKNETFKLHVDSVWNRTSLT